MTNAPKAADWTYASGLAAARQGQLHTIAFFGQIAAESGLDGLQRRLSETLLRDSAAAPGGLRQLGGRADATFRVALDEMRQVCPSDAVVRLFEIQAQFVRFKGFVKRRDLGLPLDSEWDRPDEDELWERLWAGLPAEAPAGMGLAIERARAALISAPGRPEVLDAAVDGACLAVLCAEAERSCGPFIAGYFRRHDTALGLSALWRARLLKWDELVEEALVRDRQEPALFEALLAAEESDWPDVAGRALDGLRMESVQDARGPARAVAFHAAADEWLMDYARQARYVAFGPEPVFGYLLGVRAELDNLKIAIGGRAAGVPGELLERRLRACYVQ